MNLLEPGILNQEEWNRQIIPAIKAGKIKERRDLVKDGFLSIYQVFSSILEENSLLWRVNAWAPPGDKPYVVVVPYLPSYMLEHPYAKDAG